MKKDLCLLKADSEITYTFFDAAGGDAIWIRYFGDDSHWHNILIDGGFPWSYKSGFAVVLDQLLKAGESVDLWVISHVDSDHIGAVMGFIEDPDFKDKSQLVKEYWFNHNKFPVPPAGRKLGFKQGKNLRDYLSGTGKLPLEKITIGIADRNIYGLNFTVLSPTDEKLVASQKDWTNRENKKLGRGVDQADHKKKISELISGKFSEDDDIANGSSISFIARYKDNRAILLADSHPTDIINSLTDPEIVPDKSSSYSFLKVAHHGSKKNTNIQVLSLIDTNVYVISANGETNRHPDKETLVRIITRETRTVDQIELVFISDTPAVRNMFAPDDDPYSKYNFKTTFLEDGKNYYQLSFYPIKD